MQPLVPKLRSIKIGDQVLDLDRILNADWDNVAEAAQKLPGAISWLAWERGIQYQRVEARKRYVKEAEAEAYFKLKGGQFESMGYGAKPTDAAIKHAVVLDESVKIACESLEKAQRLLVIYGGQLEALRSKLEMVRTSEATRRRLIEGIPDEAVKLASTNHEEEEDN